MNKDSSTNSLTELANQMQFLILSAIRQAVIDVDNIIQNKITDEKIVEETFDKMIEFAYDDAILILYKQLCRYYYKINEVSTVSYVNLYREMWDSEEEE